MMIDTGKHPKETYTYIFADPQGDTIDCYKSPDDRQTVCKLWEVKEAAAFHDEGCQEATRKINAIFERLEMRNGDKSRHLSFVQHRNRLLLVWASYGRVGPDDDFKTIRKALKLKK
jgi:hypothetical protein